MKKLLFSISLGFAFGASAQVGQYLNTNVGLSSLTATLPGNLVLPGSTMLGPSFETLQGYGWCQVAYWQTPAVGYSATGYKISNSAPAKVSVYITGQLNNNSNIVAQWDSNLMTNALQYFWLLSKYIPSNYVGSAVTTPATSSSWVREQVRTNAAFSVSNSVDVLTAINLAQGLISAPGNTNGTTSGFPWWLFFRVMTNGYPLP